MVKEIERKMETIGERKGERERRESDRENKIN